MRLARQTIFQVHCETPFGAEVRVVGSSESLGRWDPTRGARLDTGPRLYPTWKSRSSVLLEEGEVEFKYVIVKGDEVIWECCTNRFLPSVVSELSDCQAILILNTFNDGSTNRSVQLRPFPDRRAFSHLRKAQRVGCHSLGFASSAGHEEPSSTKSSCQHLHFGLCACGDSTASGMSGMTRASSSDSVTLIDEDIAESSRSFMIVFPQSASPPGCIATFAELFGTFTSPAWSHPVEMQFCPETGLWWVLLEEALPRLQPGTYEFKFLVNGSVWATNPALPEISSMYGCANNQLFIDYRLVTKIEKKASMPLCRRSVSLTERSIPSQDNEMASEELQPRRAISAAERLHRIGNELPKNRKQSRAVSSPHLIGQPQDTDNSTIWDSICSTSGGKLYGQDVVLLLELPDLKRSSDLSVVAGAFNKPKNGTGEGEDSYFVSSSALGVADGVGGLKEILGYTSKEFADDLMAGCQRTAQSQLNSGARASEGAASILREGYAQVATHGAATAVVAYFDPRHNKLGVAGLGDSGVMVIRRPTLQTSEDTISSVRSTRSFVVFKSPSQQHDFNYPFQLCSLPKQLKKRMLRKPDQPSDCFSFDIDVEEGDLILLYSDGVDDNLHQHELLDICDRALSPYAAHVLGLYPDAATPPELVARAIGSSAYLRSRNKKARTPFAEEARKAGWPLSWCVGGKEDDITCIASWVTCRTPAELEQSDGTLQKLP